VFRLPGGSRKRQSLSSLQHATLFFSEQIWGVAESCRYSLDDVFCAVEDQFIAPEIDFHDIRPRETISLSPRLELAFTLPHLKFGTLTTRNSSKITRWSETERLSKKGHLLKHSVIKMYKLTSCLWIETYFSRSVEPFWLFALSHEEFHNVKNQTISNNHLCPSFE
jgi:hypothetical protein